MSNMRASASTSTRNRSRHSYCLIATLCICVHYALLSVVTEAAVFSGCSLRQQPESSGADEAPPVNGGDRRNLGFQGSGNHAAALAGRQKAHSDRINLDVGDFNLFRCADETVAHMPEGANPTSRADVINGTVAVPSIVVEMSLSPNFPPVRFEIIEKTPPKTAGGVRMKSFHGRRVAMQTLADTNRDGTSPEVPAEVPDDFSEVNMLASEDGHFCGSAQMDGSIFNFDMERNEFGVVTVQSVETKISDLPPDESRIQDHYPPEDDDEDESELPVEAQLAGTDEFVPSSEGSKSSKIASRGTSKSSSNPEGRSLLRASAHQEKHVERVLQTANDDIDVLVAYTNRMACAMSDEKVGSPTACLVNNFRKQRVNDRVQLAMEESNGALEASGVIVPGGPRLRLLDTYLIPDTKGWDEQEVTYDDILDAASKRDGFMDSILDKRDELGADMVLVLTDNQDSCGLAYSGTPVSSKWTFAVVNWRCATGYYSFAHELAHLLGTRHDRRIEQCDARGCCGGKKACDSYGYLDPENRYRSIMSYNCPVAGGCPRLQMFSTPNHNFEVVVEAAADKNYKMGVARETDNANRILESWNRVAGYRTRQVEIDAVEEESATVAQAPVEVNTGATFDGSRCGDGFCRGRHGENCQNCPEDCLGVVYETEEGTVGKIECGNGICEPLENCNNCPLDCARRLVFAKERNFCCVGGGAEWRTRFVKNGVACTDVNCQYAGRECSSAPWLPNVEQRVEYCCGDGKCTKGETVSTCDQDCQCVDNGICEDFEDEACYDCQKDVNWMKNNVFEKDVNGVPIRNNKCLYDDGPCFGIFPDPCCGACFEGKCVNWNPTN